MSHSVFTPFLRRFTDEVHLERSETIALFNDVHRQHFSSAWAAPDIVERISNKVAAIIGDAIDVPPYQPLAEALDTCQRQVVALETTIVSFPQIDWNRAHLSMTEGIDLRRFLRAKQHFLANQERVFKDLQIALINVFGGIIQSLPNLPTEDGSRSLRLPLLALIPKPNEVVDGIIGTLTDETLVNAGLFSQLQSRLYVNVCEASGIPPYTETKRPLITAVRSDLPPDELIDAYLKGTPFLELLRTPVPFEIPEKVRFQHHWIVAPPGAGKSTALQHFILRDLESVAADEASIVVMESNRDLVKAIEGLKAFAPGQILAGKLVSIDVEDVEWPIAFNLFDVGMESIRALPPRDQEAMLNSVNYLYDYIFGALLSAELTSRQNTLFNFTIELLLQIPSATLDTLIDLMQPKGIEQYKEYLPLVSHDAQRFFALKFNSTEFNKTKDQVVDRLFAVKRIRALSRMFSAPRSKLDLFKEMGGAKVILINAAQSLLQQDGVEILGRFFIAQILLAAQKRQLLPQSQRLPCFFYIDECQDFIKRDPKIPVILDQARKLNVGVILAHQRLAQLDHSVLDALYGATSVKFATQLSDANAHALARDMRTTPEFILDQPPYHFAAFIRGVTPTAVSVAIPLTDMNRMPRMTQAEHAAVRNDIRSQYAIHVDQLRLIGPPAGSAPPRPTEAPAQMKQPARPSEQQQEPPTAPPPQRGKRAKWPM